MARQEGPDSLPDDPRGPHEVDYEIDRRGQKDPPRDAEQHEPGDARGEAVVLLGDLELGCALPQPGLLDTGQGEHVKPGHGVKHPIASRRLEEQQDRAVGGMRLGVPHALDGHEGVGDAPGLRFRKDVPATAQTHAAGDL